MATISATVAMMSVYATTVADPSFVTGASASLSASGTLTASFQGQVGSAPLVANVVMTVESATYSGAVSYDAAVVYFWGSGNLEAITKTVPVYAPPTGVVDNIEDLPTDLIDGAVYEVRGTSSNRSHVIAIWSDLENMWIYQPVLLGRNTNSIHYINTSFGVHLSMHDFINFNGVPHTPKYWSVSTCEPVGGLLSPLQYSLVPIPDPIVQAVPGALSVWRWKVEDLADPGTGSYSLNVWPEHSGSGPSWHSNSFYRPKVKSTTKFNIKKAKTRKQRSVTFVPNAVDHMWMEYPPGLTQPFTVIACGIIHSYPTAKFGHYILDTAKETPIFNANRTGRDFFFHEGAEPRNVMLFMKKSALMAVNNHPYRDLKKSKYIRAKHNYKARPRVWYGLFNGDNSFLGSRDVKYKFHKDGALLDLSPHRYFGIGRRVDRVSDNRASHMSIWEIIFINGALTKDDVYGVYEELSNYYQFKEYG